jgi:hypothetical protein
VQVTLAVLVSALAHVLHAVYMPWGLSSQTYYVQHMSLFVTTFVFTMGLLFKVKGVSQASGVFAGLSALMLLLCVGFGVVWVSTMLVGVVHTVRRNRLTKRLSGPRKGSEADSDGNEGGTPTLPPGEQSREALNAPGTITFVDNPALRARRLLGSGVSSRLLHSAKATTGAPAAADAGASAAAAAVGAAATPATAAQSSLRNVRRLLGAGASSRLLHSAKPTTGAPAAADAESSAAAAAVGAVATPATAAQSSLRNVRRLLGAGASARLLVTVPSARRDTHAPTAPSSVAAEGAAEDPSPHAPVASLTPPTGPTLRPPPPPPPPRPAPASPWHGATPPPPPPRSDVGPAGLSFSSAVANSLHRLLAKGGAAGAAGSRRALGLAAVVGAAQRRVREPGVHVTHGGGATATPGGTPDATGEGPAAQSVNVEPAGYVQAGAPALAAPALTGHGQRALRAGRMRVAQQG